ncbi:glycosyltransferase family 2 protein [Mycoplana rhizolycopersici]|uniref:Glycosyltransferase family 2 protein n=1 Tax=Mycoplana rhizolycopersici TaxID=2746702 RepID=A0ABX2QCZ1_9HYPH|nr:glycosyltransferase family A protein [Rhizobium rhizolycopersici]NVP54857.1 glycosyltransferase family 2 protein [Rhizobium rhizolycopersici]
MNNAPRVSIVIRTYNEANYIGRLLYGISQQTFQDFEIVLVDSGSTDNTVDIARTYGARIVTIPKSEFSFGRSLNIGCEAARGELIVIASGHVYPQRSTWLSKMIEPFSDKRVALVFGKQRGDHRTKFSENILFLKTYPDSGDGIQGDYFCNNANCAIRREDWQKHPYDEKLTGLEDIHYARHFFESGRHVHYCRDATIVHVHEECWRRIRNRYMREAIAMRHIEPSIQLGFAKALALILVHVVGDGWHAMRLGRIRREMYGILCFRFNQIWGTYLGYRRGNAVTEELKRRFYYPGAAVAIVEEENCEFLIDYKCSVVNKG